MIVLINNIPIIKLNSFKIHIKYNFLRILEKLKLKFLFSEYKNLNVILFIKF